MAMARIAELPLRNTLPVSSSSSSYRIFSSSLYKLKHSLPPLLKPPNYLRFPSHCLPKSTYSRATNAASSESLDRIVLRLRNLGLGDDPDPQLKPQPRTLDQTFTGEEKLTELLDREWIRPDAFLLSDDDDATADEVLPWEREDVPETYSRKKRRPSRAPTLAELTMEDDDLRRLRRDGMLLRERVTIPKAGVTEQVLEKIHDRWRREELVRLKFHEDLTHDMKTAHEIVEKRTGGMVTWRAGSVMVVYRGPNYQGPLKPCFPEDNPPPQNPSTDDKIVTFPTRRDKPEEMNEEEEEYDRLLDGLGPRYNDWWGTGFFPVDGDKLAEKLPGYKTPLRFLPNGMRSKLTNSEVTNLRKLSKSLPCHFAIGRNRNHQGMAASIVKLWEKSLIVKIAVKRGIQNTNNKLMAEELKELTGGVLLLRNKYYIVIYRGKDFVPKSVAVALAERDEESKRSVDMEEVMRSKLGISEEETQDQVHEFERGRIAMKLLHEEEGKIVAGTLAEFYDAQSRWRRSISDDQYEKMMEEASRAKKEKLIRGIERKLSLAQTKKAKAERLLAKIESSMVGTGPDYDQETIADEERAMFRRVGLRMKAYLPLGIRGIFDGVIENMHLHWKHRELVKLITKEKAMQHVEDTGRLLEYESGGILVAIERVPKGFALIYFRGKNYKRPISIRPRNLLNKAKALKRAVAIQRHQALSDHISQLENTIQQMAKEIGNYEANQATWDDFASDTSDNETETETETEIGTEDEPED